MADLTKEQIIDAIADMSVMDVCDLCDFANCQ